MKNIKLYIRGGRRVAPLRGLEFEPELFDGDPSVGWWFIGRFVSYAEARAEARAISQHLKRGRGRQSVYFRFERGCVGMREVRR